MSSPWDLRSQAQPWSPGLVSEPPLSSSGTDAAAVLPLSKDVGHSHQDWPPLKPEVKLLRPCQDAVSRSWLPRIGFLIHSQE